MSCLLIRHNISNSEARSYPSRLHTLSPVRQKCTIGCWMTAGACQGAQEWAKYRNTSFVSGANRKSAIGAQKKKICYEIGQPSWRNAKKTLNIQILSPFCIKLKYNEQIFQGFVEFEHNYVRHTGLEKNGIKQNRLVAFVQIVWNENGKGGKNPGLISSSIWARNEFWIQFGFVLSSPSLCASAVVGVFCFAKMTGDLERSYMISHLFCT